MYVTIDKYTTVWKRDLDTGKYSYPINLESEEWYILNHAEKAILCDIPDYVLSDITYEELVELMLDYPLLLDVYAYSSFEEGLEVVSMYFKGLDKVLNSKTIDFCFNSYSNPSSKHDNSTGINEIKSIQDSLKKDFIEDFCEYKRIIKDSISNNVQKSTNTYIYTPNGTQVSAIVYGELLSVEDKENYKNYVETFYSNCTFISEATTNYNCHSYAWYSQSTSNLVWLPNPSAYMTDGSYVYIGTSSTGASQKVYYAYPGNEHSGVVFYQPANTIISKWGQLPLMVHNVYDCPYFYIPLNPDNIKYYELDY